MNILTCNDPSGSWCCAYSSDPSTCCNVKWLPLLGSVLANAVQVISTSTIPVTMNTLTVYSTISMAMSTLTVFSTETSSGSPCNSSVAIGAGVGVPLGIIALVSSSYAIWLYRRGRASPISAQVQASGMGYYNEQLVGNEHLEGANRAELLYVPAQELENQEVYEAPGANRDR